MAEGQEEKIPMRKQKKLQRSWHGFSKRCEEIVKEQRARLYILRRCTTMLLCLYIRGSD